MNTHTITKTMISSVVAHGLREMEQDPRRNVRRLADLGKRFSRSRFQDLIFSIMQELLAHEDSSYYDLMANLLKNTDHEAMRTFGVNLGCSAWTYGARLIRKEEETSSFAIPWALLFCYDPSADGALCISSLQKLISEGTSLGIYAYFIRQCGEPSDSCELLSLFEQNPDCAFLWIPEHGTLTAEQICLLRNCKNTMAVLPGDDPETSRTAALLRGQKILFALSLGYSDKTCATVCTDASFRCALEAQTSFLFLISGDPQGQNAEKFCCDARLKQEYPCFMMDYYADARSLSRFLADHDALLEIGADGRLLQPAAQKGIPFDFDRPLKEALAAVMPAIRLTPSSEASQPSSK